jgi:Fe-S cluster assembly protein SufD
MEAVSDKLTLDTQLSDWYFANRDQLMSASHSVFNSVRPAAMESFRKLGIPDRSFENYKFTDIARVFSSPLNRHVEPRKILFDVEDLFHCDIPELDTELVLLVNGWFYENRPRLEVLPGGMIIGSMAEAAKQYPELLAKHYSKYADHTRDGLVALNTAFAQDGTFIYVPSGTVNNRAVQIVNILLSPEDLFVQHRNLVIVEENASARVVVCDHSLSARQFLTNSVTEVFVGENAHLDYVKLQNENDNCNQISTSFVHQERSSEAVFNTITLHGGLIRNNVYTRLNGEGASNETLGLFLVDKTQHVDNYTFVDHAVPNCTSRQNFKGILDDQATAAFTGRILVQPQAQKTMAYQKNNNILFSNEARMNTKPQLEIYADDVKCSHGATVGQLDPNAVFYLQSRGISLREAKLLLMYAFGHEILNKISVDPLRDRLSDLVEKRLRGELTRCNSCPLHCQETC